MAELDWGREFLMCPPDHFGVLYEINPWMDTAIQVDRELARQQWENLVQALKEAGATIKFQPPAQGWPDLVFTANAGIVNGKQFIPTTFKWPERQGETKFDIEWFEAAGYTIDRFPEGLVHEGVGDALPFGTPQNRVLVSGYQTRSDAASHAHLSSMISTPVMSVKLIDDRLYHLDLTFTPLTERRAIVAPMAFDKAGMKSMAALVPEMLVLENEEALQFCCNSVVVGTNIIMPNCPPRVGRQLESWGFNIQVVNVSEFMKGGGGCRCLSLALDVSLTPVQS